MPVTQDIRSAIERGDKAAAESLYAEVLGKNNGNGLSGHDQQILSAEIAGMEDAGAQPLQVQPKPEAPKTRSTSRAVKIDPIDGVVDAE